MSKYRKTSDVQNRFTSYLVTAVINRKYQYLHKRASQQEMETDFINIEEQSFFYFETEFAKYLTEQFVELWDNISKIQVNIPVLRNHKSGK